MKCMKCVKMCILLVIAISAGFFSTANAETALEADGQQQQIKKVTGVVLYKEDNQPVMGATVQVEGTKIAVSTDLDGKFVINNVPQTAKNIKISFVGLTTQVVTISPKMTILMESDAIAMDEIMVVAYGTAKKSSFTGSASVINSETFESKPTTTITNALVATTPGLMVSSANGMPGSSPSVYIRGLSSVNGDNTPLYVVDGMIYDGDISNLNSDDIESMTVLKDASSTALYGAKAASGVVMITTKHGKKERMNVRAKFTQGFTTRQSDDYKKLGAEDYVVAYWDGFRNSKIGNGTDPAVAGQEVSEEMFETMVYNPYNVPSDQVIDANGVFNRNAKLKWHDTDWYDAITRLGKRTDGSISISGGTKKSDYFTSLGYTREQGYVIGSEFKRYTARANVNSQINKFLKVGTNLGANLSYSKGNQYETSGQNANGFRFARYVNPFTPIYLHNPETGEFILDEFGNRIYDYGVGYDDNDNNIHVGKRPYIPKNNPAKDMRDRFDKYQRANVNAKVYAEVTFLKDFKFTFNGGVGANMYWSSSATPIVEEKNNLGNASKTDTRTTTWTYNQLLSYSKEIDKHHVDVTLGHESYEKEYNNLNASRKGQAFPGDNYELSNYTDIDDQPGSYTNKLASEGYFARLNYDYGGKYFFSASFRRDGSSVFYKDSRWGNFWSVGGGWRIDQEKFMKNVKWVNYLKLRGSYGEVGNDRGVGYYPWRATYSQKQNAEESGYVVGNLGNKNLTWEVSHNWDVAVEFDVFKRLSGSFEFFRRQSSNMLYDMPLAPNTSFSTQTINAGSMYNMGYEIELTGKVIANRNFSWTLGVNGTHIKNKITKLPIEPKTSGVHRLEEGHSRYEFYLYEFKGVDPATGRSLYTPSEAALKLKDPNDPTSGPAGKSLVEVDGKTYTTDLDEASRAFRGGSMPKLTGGITTNFAYKGFDLSLTFYYQLGGKMYDEAYYNLMVGGGGSRMYPALHKDMLKRWRQPGDKTNVPVFYYSNAGDIVKSDLNGSYSTRWIVSSNMLELTTLNLGYKFPRKWMEPLGISNLRVYFAGDNLMLFTKRRGTYPRRAIFSGYYSNPDTYTPARVFTFGVTVDF